MLPCHGQHRGAGLCPGLKLDCGVIGTQPVELIQSLFYIAQVQGRANLARKGGVDLALMRAWRGVHDDVFQPALDDHNLQCAIGQVLFRQKRP